MDHDEHIDHRIVRLLLDLLERMIRMAGELDGILAAVANIDGKADSLIALAQQLSTLIAANKTDPVALQAIADDLNKKAGDIQTAVDTFTPPAVP